MVLENKDKPGVWQVAWTWMPYFLAADTELVKYVDQEMTELFADRSPTAAEMHEAVVALIEEKYPIKGLRPWLQEIIRVQPEERA